MKTRGSPVFEVGFHRTDDVLCTYVTNTMALQPKDYLAQSGTYTPLSSYLRAQVPPPQHRFLVVLPCLKTGKTPIERGSG